MLETVFAMILCSAGVPDVLPREHWKKSWVTESLVREHFAAGRYLAALHAYARWTPGSHCGTCLQSMEGERFRRMTLCHIHLSNHAAAARVALNAFQTPGWSDRELALILFNLYRDAGQTADLAKMLTPLEVIVLDAVWHGAGVPNLRRDACLRYLPVTGIRELFRIAALGEEEKIEELVQIVLEDRGPMVRQQFAAEVLAACGDDAARLILVTAADTGKESSWFHYTLGKMTTPYSLEVLTEFARVERGWNSKSVIDALGTRGDAGLKVIKRISADQKHGLQATGEMWLKDPPKPPPAPPKPKAGNLPRTLPN